MTTLGTFVRPFVRLAADEAPEARVELNDLMRQWSREGFHLQHTMGTYRMVELDLYEGDAATARERAAALWSDGASLLVRMQHLRILVGHGLARGALAGATAMSNRDPLLRDAECSARRLEGVRMGSAALAKLVRAGIAAVRGDAPRAVALLTEAAAGFDAADMRLHAAAARRRLGGLLGGTEGEALVAKADAWMAGQQIRNPARLTATLAPGSGDGRA
jgi:hypothetical protein